MAQHSYENNVMTQRSYENNIMTQRSYENNVMTQRSYENNVMTHENVAHQMASQPVTQYNLPPKKPRVDQPPVLTLQEANELKEQISQLHPDQQLQILEILQNNGEQLYPDEHGEVEIEIAKCCLGSVKQVKNPSP
jgi:hypothetical protein